MTSTDSANSTRILHIHCGDSSAQVLRESQLPGDVLVWTELLHEGPTPLEVDNETWLHLRASFLASTDHALTADGCLRMLKGQDEALEHFNAYDEAVLWFDACLFDQTILIRQLDWFSRQQMGDTTISLICIGEFPGMPHFRGLGELNAHQMASLFPSRHQITKAESDLAVAAWQAFRSTDPTDIEAVLQRDTTALPYLADALHRHLEQFPASRNGLSRLEEEGLRAITDEHHTFSSIFRQTSAMEKRPFFGDTTLWRALMGLVTGNIPALEAIQQDTAIGLAGWQFQPTDFGRALLDGKADWVKENGIDRWLGGAHLHGHDVWRWNGEHLIQGAD